MWLDEIGAYLQTQLIGTVGTNIFISSVSHPPDNDGPYLTLLEYPGLGQLKIQNVILGYERPSGQMIARCKTYMAARNMLQSAYLAINGRVNITLSGTLYLMIDVRSGPFDLPPDGRGRARCAINFDALKVPS